MAVYVDHARNRLGRMLMSHMVADTIGELLDMADRIGLDRRHFQPGSHPHFDVCQSYRSRAVAAGAVEVDRRGLVVAMKRHRGLLARDGVERTALENATARCTRGLMIQRV